MLQSKTLPKTSGAFIAQRVMSATDPDNALFRGGDPDFMTSLARGLHVIRAFAGVDRRLTIADVSRVASKYVDKSKLAVVVVGNSADFDRPLASFGTVAKIDISIPGTPPGQ